MSEKIRRRQARSESVDYSDPVEIHDSARLRIELVPFYIGQTFAAKIIRYDKTKGWEQTAISIQSEAVRRLQETLSQHLAVALESRGNYLVISTDGSVGDIGDLDLETVAGAIAQLLHTDGMAAQLSRLGFPRNRGGLLIAGGASHSLALRCHRGGSCALEAI